jgi:cytochrome c
MGGGPMMGRGLVMPMMDPARGRKLFASKGCVVCHSVNGVGGKDAPALDASTMSQVMNPFEFAARMWRGAEAMIVLQRETLGEQIELTGNELADIIAFTHDPQEQHKFSEADVPEPMLGLIEHSHGAEAGTHEHMHKPEDKHD